MKCDRNVLQLHLPHIAKSRGNKEKFLNAIYSNEGVTESIKVDCIKYMKGLNGQ